MKVNAKEMYSQLLDIVRAGITPMLVSSPGVGKTAIVRQFAEDNNLHLIDIRLSQMDSLDISGLPIAKTNNASYLPMDIFPLKHTPIPEGKVGFCIFADEITSASIPVQAACYQLILDRAVGQHKLHPKTIVIAAGNKTTDRAIVNRTSTAMQSRMVHFELWADPKLWIDWALVNNIDHRIVSYIRYRPDKLHIFDPDHSDFTFPCPRTWEFMSNIMSNWEQLSESKLPVIAGTVGEGTAREFYNYALMEDDLVKFDDILKNPSSAKLPSEPGQKYFISGMIAARFSETDANQLMTYVRRLDPEFQVIVMRSVIARLKGIENQEDIREWWVDHAEEFL